MLSCGITILQNQAVCGNFNAVCGFLMLFCAVFIRNSVRFCDIRTPLTPPAHIPIKKFRGNAPDPPRKSKATRDFHPKDKS